MHMKIGKAIQDWRKKEGVTQKQLAETLFVTPQAISNWERGKNLPDLEKLHEISEIIGMPVNPLAGENVDSLSFDWKLRENGDSEARMFTRIKTIAEYDGLEETYQALYFAREAYSGQHRRMRKFTSVKPDFFVHPLQMTCLLQSMQIEEDAVLAVSLLHDVCKPGGPVPEDLPFSDTVRHSVKLLTKDKDPALTKEEHNIQYFDGIRHDRIASVVKLVERYDNVSTMVQVFPVERLNEYIVETEIFVLPLLKEVKHCWPEYTNLTFLVKNHLVTILENTKTMLLMMSARQ